MTLQAFACAPFISRQYTEAAVIDKREAFEQLEASVLLLRRLLKDDEYARVTAGGGDALRREIGFVGTGSPLFSIDKALTVLRDEAMDPVEYGEEFERFSYALRMADNDAYSANFVEFSAAKATPAGYFKSAKNELRQAYASLANLFDLIPPQ
mmetsp:Transcript_17572/g.22922  ORF Transcript_17572/g.22922 Transcript_17572/m.22922 type:complete len:153 (-) Transcript_17572:1281-1739(-)